MCGASICGTYRQRCGSKWRQRFTPASASAFPVRRLSSGYCTQGTAGSAPAARSSRGSRRSDSTRDRRDLSRDVSSGCSEGLALGDRVRIVDTTQLRFNQGNPLEGCAASWQLVQQVRTEPRKQHVQDHGPTRRCRRERSCGRVLGRFARLTTPANIACARVRSAKRAKALVCAATNQRFETEANGVGVGLRSRRGLRLP